MERGEEAANLKYHSLRRFRARSAATAAAELLGEVVTAVEGEEDPQLVAGVVE